MSYLQTCLKIFHVYDGENHYFLAEEEEHVRDYFENEYLDDYQKEEMEKDFGSVKEAYEVKEINTDTNIEVTLDCGAEPELISLLKKVKKDDEPYRVNIWTLVKYILLQDEIFNREILTPVLIASSVQ